MKESVKQNIIISWVVWHFYEMSRFLFSVWENFIWFSAGFFSVPLLIRTLFSPWRRYKWRYPKGFDIGEFFSTLISNIFSRIVGAFARTVLILLGIASQLFILLFGGIVFLLWIFLPLIFLLLMYFVFIWVMNPVRDQSLMYYVYVIESQRSKYWYTGSTDDLRKRLNQHNKGESTWTKQGIPWKLIYYEASLRREDAQSREKYLKSGPGKRYLKNRLRRFLSLTGWTFI